MQEFAIAPGGIKPLWLLLPIGVVLAGVAVLLAISLMGAKSSRFDVAADGLRLRGDFYGRFIPWTQLHVASARRVDVESEAGLRPRRRTLGTALPGYRSGWFRLANGEKALLYLTDARKAVYIPTTEGFSLLLSPDDPDAFLSALQSARR